MDRYYVTTPIYYVNDLPHIGHAYTTVAADVLARFKRLQGKDVFFATGTDEHGIKIERSARERGRLPQDYVDDVAAAYQRLWQKLHISYDDFIRTSQPRHRKVAQTIFEKAHEAGDIYKGHYEGWYCTPDETFLSEKELEDGNCPTCGRTAEWITEESYFFRLSKYQDWIEGWLQENPEFVEPASRRNEVVSFVKSGLKDLCVSRSTFKWGIPVPFDSEQVIYVWIDALTNYLSVIGYQDDEEKFNRYWPANVHLIGKEILRFHAIIWPIMLKSVGLPLPRKVFAHGWWTVEGKKMSKSKGNVIDPATLAEELASKSGADYEVAIDAVRYFLLREVPFGLDGDFSLASFWGRFNADLANDFGNLLTRTLPLVERYFEGRIPPPREPDERDEQLRGLAVEVLEEVPARLDRLEFSQALSEIWRLLGATNKYIDEAAPWSAVKDNEPLAGAIIYNVLEVLRIGALLVLPFMPVVAERIWRQMGMTASPSTLKLQEAGVWGRLEPGLATLREEPLFPRIEK